jgi:N-acetylmuramoyl-L-alanine amidase
MPLDVAVFDDTAENDGLTGSENVEPEVRFDGEQPFLDLHREAAAGPQPEDPESATVPLLEKPSLEVEAAPEETARIKRVGIQAGHWRSAELPAELAGLRTSTGTSGGGVAEWQLNLDIARRMAPILEAEGIEVDILPATIPPGYKADAFVALHADGDLSGRLSGFKLATPRVSATADADNALLAAITAEYQAATKLKLDYNITRNMTGYYAFSFRRFTHAIAPSTAAVIVEMGFLTNASDRTTLLGRPNVVADGIAQGVLRFLVEREG